MLLYNVPEMSSTTPNRSARGVVVPGIDTRVTNDLKQPSISFNEWPLTPQSANDSRRPSLAYSSFSDMSRSGPSSIGGYSQPATPVNNMSGSTEYRTPWSHDPEALPLPALSTGMDGCTTGHMSQQMYSSAFPYTMSAVPAPNNLTNGLPFGSQPDQTNTFGLPTTMRSDWEQSQRCLYGSNIHDASFNTHQATTPVALEPSSFSEYDASPVTASYHNIPQVVVPSQVGPHEDFPIEQYPKYDSQQEVHNGFNHSFDSSATGYSSGWDNINSSSSPNDGYFAQSEDDGDLVMVNHTTSLTPTRSVLHQGQPLHVHTTSNRPRPRCRTTKRGRKTTREGKAWYKAEGAGITVVCAGPRFRIPEEERDVVGGRTLSDRLNREDTKEPKPFICDFLKPDGPCAARFRRGEHLKRHSKTHEPVKEFKCPLPTCKAKPISRSDNAGDHFRTHLRQRKKGKRNESYGWKRVRGLILECFEEKAANRMVTNLTKWLNENYCSEEFTGMTLMQWHRMREFESAEEEV